MKKILALLMILTVSLSLFACGKADGDGKESTTGNTIAVDKTEDTTAPSRSNNGGRNEGG